MRYRPSSFVTILFPTLRRRWPPREALGPEGDFPSGLLLTESTFHRLGGRLDDVEALHVPRVEREHRPAEPARQRDLAQRPPPRADRDHAVGRGHDHQVAGLAEAGRNRDGEMRV